MALGLSALPMSVLARDAMPSENDLLVSSHSAVTGTVAATTLSSLSFSDLPFSTGVGSNAIADVNADGHLDVVNGLGLQVWLGNGDGTLTSVVSPLINGFDVAIADLDGDGRLDAVTTGSNGFVQVFAGNGDGTFQAPKKYKGAKNVIDIGAGDLNGDGIPEIVGTDTEDDKAFVLVRNSGGGGYKDRVRYDVGSVPRGIRIADMNGDGRPDLVVANSASHTISILLGNGDTSFQPQIVTPSLAPAGIAPRILRVGDFNGDGKLDVAASMTASNGFGTTGAVVLLGNGDGTLGAKTAYALGNPLDTDRSLDIGDLNQDGVLDLAVNFTPLSSPAGVHILLGNGDGTFTFDSSQTVTQSSNTVNIADMNEDGRNDIITDVEVLLNLGPTPALWSQSTTRAAALRPGVWNSSVWPNPLVGPTQLRFNIAEASPVSVRLFDARGRLVKTLLDGRWTEAGPQELTIGGLGLRAGVYMYRIDAGGNHTGGRFVVLE